MKKSLKQEVKKPDMVMVAAEWLLTYVRTHLTYVIIGVGVCCVAALSVYGYTAYTDRQNEKAQVTIFEGVRDFESFIQTGKKEDLDKAEKVMQKVAEERPGKVYKVAELYLASIYTLKGKDEEARKTYQRLEQDGSVTLRMLSERALKNMDSK